MLIKGLQYYRNKRTTYLVILCSGQWRGTAAHGLLKHSGTEFQMSFFLNKFFVLTHNFLGLHKNKLIF